jgi:glycosyltransferase involved in cell wall biosynthesis
MYALHMIEALSALGRHLIVYTSRPDLITASRATVRRVSAAYRPERGLVGHMLRLLWVQSGLRLRVWRARPQVLLNLMPEGILLPSVPQITIVHDMLPLLYPEEYPRQQYYFRYYVPMVLNHSRAVIVISESTKRDILRFYRLPPDKVHVVLSGYDSQRFTPRPGDIVDGRSSYVLYIGNVMPHKNLLRLAEAFALVARRASVNLVIRGSGRAAHVQSLRKRIAELGIESRVDWQPYALPDELPRLYRGARMLLLPSLYEGFGLTALEAMACGTPVVAANTSSIPEVIGDAGLLVDPRDTDSITDAILRLLTDGALRKELVARGLARAKDFSWERTARRVLEVLDEAAGFEGLPR